MGSFLSCSGFIGRASGGALEGDAAGSRFSGVLPDCLGTVVAAEDDGANAEPELGRCKG